MSIVRKKQTETPVASGRWIALAVASLVACGCAHLSTPEEFDAEVRHAVPIGTPVPVAVSTLEREGLNCRHVESQACTPEIQKVNDFLKRIESEFPRVRCPDVERTCGWERHVLCTRPIGFSLGKPAIPTDRVTLWISESNKVANLDAFRAPIKNNCGASLRLVNRQSAGAMHTLEQVISNPHD